MLASLTRDSFAPLAGDRIVLHLGEGDTVDLELIEVSGAAPASTGDALAAGRRTPFSIVLRGPRERPLRQQIHALEHAQLGRLEIFLVPIGPDEHGLRYEAVFA